LQRLGQMKYRKPLVVIVILLFAVNLYFVHQKSRPIQPEIMMDSITTFGLFVENGQEREFPRMGSENKWYVGKEPLLDPLKKVQYTVPNADGPDYTISIFAKKEASFGDFIRTSRALCRLGILNFFFVNTEFSKKSQTDFPLLMLEKVMDESNGTYRMCETNHEILFNYDRKIAEYEKLQAAKLKR